MKLWKQHNQVALRWHEENRLWTIIFSSYLWENELFKHVYASRKGVAGPGATTGGCKPPFSAPGVCKALWKSFIKIYFWNFPYWRGRKCVANRCCGLHSCKSLFFWEGLAPGTKWGSRCWIPLAVQREPRIKLWDCVSDEPLPLVVSGSQDILSVVLGWQSGQ